MALLPSLPSPWSPTQVAEAAANVFDKVVRGGLADLRPTPARIIHEQPQCTVFRYLPRDGAPAGHLPVLLVPPLAAPALCFDLRRGHSLAEHLGLRARRTDLLADGEIEFRNRDLG